MKETHYEWFSRFEDYEVEDYVKYIGCNENAAYCMISLFSIIECTSAFGHELSSEEEYPMFYLSTSGNAETSRVDLEVDDIAMYSNVALSVMRMNKSKQVFRISESLYEDMSTTDIKINTEMFPIPYNSFYVYLDNPILVNGMYINGAYVSTETSGNHNKLRVVFVSTVEKHKYDAKTVIVDFLVMEYRAGETWEKTFEELESRCMEKDMLSDCYTFSSERVDCLRAIVNMIFYIGLDDSDKINYPKVHKKKIKKGKGLNRQYDSRIAYTYVGPNVKRAETLASDHSAGRKNKRHMVRGHFRNQPHGKGRKLTKVVYIKPCIKGAGNNSLERVYKVKDNKNAKV